MDNNMSILLRRYVWNERRSREQARIQRSEKGFATIGLSTTGFLGKREPVRKKSFRKGKRADMLLSQQGMHVIIGNPLECSFHQRGKCKLGNKCAFKHTEKRLVANQRNEIIRWQSPKHWTTTMQRRKSLRWNPERRETFCTAHRRFQRNQF